MEYTKTEIGLSRDFPFVAEKYCGVENFKPTLHLHNALEINFIIQGRGRNIIEDHVYEFLPNDIFIINNMQYHMAFYDKSLELIVIMFEPGFVFQGCSFDYEYLRPFFSSDNRITNRIEGEEAFSKEMAGIILDINNEWQEKREGYKLIIKAQLLRFLAMIFRNFVETDRLKSDKRAYYKGFDRIREVVEYINENYTTTLKLEDLAKISHMNKTYFSSFFKKVMNMNVSDYVEMVRLNEASNLLLTTNLDVTDICYQCGFNNVSHFCTVFKKHKHLTPHGFRKQNQGK